MAYVEHEIEIKAPVRAVYDQWTQFEDFPRFMEDVQEVRQLDDRRLHWKASMAGVEREWDATITHQVPDQVVAWESTEGVRNAGTVRFRAVDGATTAVRLGLDYEPEGVLEKAGEITGIVSARVKGDLERFRDVIEEQGATAEGWRGTIDARGASDDAGEVRPQATGTGQGLPHTIEEREAKPGHVADRYRAEAPR